ncbi:hypothetical protein J5N97_030265 [Dioscorea zingiberensis]|uniref:Uncharacterized protein n=1 Tax=Dioscorea zingiberensis TaxID=325984 RepID=A0A9D5BWR1_9LILI|nr:hypothetical protein J5N97_030265 [Dioscorea zingiberensis]
MNSSPSRECSRSPAVFSPKSGRKASEIEWQIERKRRRGSGISAWIEAAFLEDNFKGAEEKGQRRSFLSFEEAGLVDISGLSTHERFLWRLTISSLNLLKNKR